MRRSLSIIAAAAIAVGASVASSAPAEAAKLMRLPAATPAQVGTIMEVNSPGHGDRHSVFRDDGWNDGWRQRRHPRFRQHRNFYPNGFYFGFPFAFRPPMHSYNRYDDCFRTWDGPLICR